MNLKIFYPDEGEERLVSESPDEAALEGAVTAVDWTRLAFVILERDERNSLDGSGSMNPEDGLSLSLLQDGIQFVSETAPGTPTDLLPALRAYLRGDEEEVFRILFAAPGRTLTPETIAELRQAEIDAQMPRLVARCLEEAGPLFRAGDFAGYVRLLEPLEAHLSPVEAKKLQLARRKL